MSPSKPKDPEFDPKPSFFSNDSWFSAPLLISISCGIWFIAYHSFTIKSDVNTVKQDVIAVKNGMWSRNEQRQFANELQWSNNSEKIQLKVPDTDQISARFPK